MTFTEEIYSTLATRFGSSASVIEVNNESDQHAVMPGSESHFHVVVVSTQFDGLSLIARHRMVYEALAEPMRTAIHAIALHTYTLSEWENRAQEAPASPACRGGSK